MGRSDDDALCGSFVQSKRGLLACGWTTVVLLTISAFISAVSFSTLSTGRQGSNNNNYYYDEDNENDENNQENEHNREEDEYQRYSNFNGAMAFAATWTAILALALSIVGCVVLGIQGPRGKWYSCCAGSVYRTNSWNMGMFVGALFMMANVTLICAILFGKFNIRSYQYNMENEREAEREREAQGRQGALDRSSIAFALMCSFLTLMYLIFAICLFISRQDVLDEYEAEERAERLSPSTTTSVWDNAFSSRKTDDRSKMSDMSDSNKLTKLLGGGRGKDKDKDKDDSSKQSKGFFKSFKKKSGSLCS